jgi:hypothetical protein
MSKTTSQDFKVWVVLGLALAGITASAVAGTGSPRTSDLHGQCTAQFCAGISVLAHQTCDGSRGGILEVDCPWALQNPPQWRFICRSGYTQSGACPN